MKRVGIKVLFYFDPIDTRWTTLSDFEHWIAKHLAENNMEAERMEILGSAELVMIIKSKQEISNLPKLHKSKPIEEQIKNLKVK